MNIFNFQSTKTITKTRMTIGEYESATIVRGKGTFQDKTTRDAVAVLLKTAGHKVKKRSARNQQLHPQYVTDYVGEYEVGFGNTDYLMIFPVLYIVEIV